MRHFQRSCVTHGVFISLLGHTQGSLVFMVNACYNVFVYSTALFDFASIAEAWRTVYDSFAGGDSLLSSLIVASS
jgi:hypothetical protein